MNFTRVILSLPFPLLPQQYLYLQLVLHHYHVLTQHSAKLGMIVPFLAQPFRW